jgi:DNA polymerase-3 subunit alpha
MGLPFTEGDRLSKMVPEILGITLKEAIEQEPRLKDLYDNPQQVATVDGKPIDTKNVLDIAMALEGLHRQAGMHAAGVVIGDKPLWEYVPVYRPSGEEGLITQFAKDEVELAGLVKFDFLGLKTLTVIQDALDLINRGRAEADKITTEIIPIDDAPLYELISRGDTAGVFQMESSGFTEMVRKLKPSCFEDVIAAGALYRPGPLDAGMVDVFINRKHGREKVTYPHPRLEPILKDTYGVIVYQEQVMQISQVLGGYSLGRADLLRRAMGKKKAEVMAKERAGFLEGCEKNSVDPKVAGEIFDLMEKFAEYGFNKSHSAAYAMITVQTAWLKAHYPVEFIAALLTSEKDNTDKIVRHIGEARADGLEVLPPDVNESELSFGAAAGSAGSRGKIRFGLGAIKGVGESAIEAIMEARKEGRFKGLSDFCERVDARRVNKKCLEALIKSGAFDFEGQPRQRLFLAIDKVVERGAGIQRDKITGQSSLFGLISTPVKQADPRVLYGDAAEWPEKVKLTFEKEAMGFYVSGHPLDAFRKELGRYAKPTSAVQSVREGEKITVAGVVAVIRERPTKSGKRMAFLTLEDTSGTVEVICFPGGGGGGGPPEPGEKRREPRLGFEQWETLLKSDQALLVTGKVQVKSQDDGERKAELVAEEIRSLAEVREKRAKRLRISVDAERVDPDKLKQLKDELDRNPGTLPVTLELEVNGEATAEIAVASKVKVSDELLAFADRLFGSQAAEVS